MGLNENKELIRRWFNELVNEKNLNALERYCSKTFFDYNPLAGAEEGGVSASREGLERLHRGLPDVRGNIDEIYAEEDRVFVRSTLTGTHTGDLMGLRASGKQLKMEVWHLFRVEDGKISEHRAQTDPLMLLRQLGGSVRNTADVILIPPPDMPTTQA